MTNISLDSDQIKVRRPLSPRPDWVITSPYRMRFGCWGDIHAMTLQGWFFIRSGNALIGHYGDVEEGRA